MKRLLSPLLFAFAINGAFSQDLILTAVGSPHIYTGGYTFPEDVIIETGATVLFASGDYQFADDHKILIENGGYLEVQNATLSTYEEQWKGIVVLPDITNNMGENQALVIENSTVKDAYQAIHIAPLVSCKMRNVFARNVTFINNKFHLYGGATPGNYLNNDAIYGTRFINCTFDDATALRPISMSTISNVNFIRCIFDYDNSANEVGVYVANGNNVEFSECHFYQTGNIGITIHYDVEDFRFIDNDFINGGYGASGIAPYQVETAYTYIGILIGGKSGSEPKNILCEGNLFTSNVSMLPTCGISAESPVAYGQYSTDIIITENKFENYGTGVHSVGCLLGINKITQNGFFDCYHGVITGNL